MSHRTFSQQYQSHRLADNLATHVDTILLTGLLVGIIAHYTNYVPTEVGTVILVLTATASLGIYVAWISRIGVQGFTEHLPRVQLLSVSLIVAIFGTHLLLGDFSGLMNAALPVYTTVVTVACLFTFPKMVPQHKLFRAIAGLGATLGVTGGIVRIIGDHGFRDFTPITDQMSVYYDPNLISMLFVVGIVIGAGYAVRDGNPRGLAVSGANLLGLYLTHARAGYLALFVTLSVLAGLEYVGRTHTRWLTGIGFGCLGVFVVVVALFPSHPLIKSLPLTSRNWLWSATLTGIVRTNPLIGAGFVDKPQWVTSFVPDPSVLFRSRGPHNGYLLMGMWTGFVGMAAYIGLISVSIRDGFRSRRVDPLVLALAVAFAVNFFITDYTLWGVTVRSVLAALVFGYLITDSTVSST